MGRTASQRNADRAAEAIELLRVSALALSAGLDGSLTLRLTFQGGVCPAVLPVWRGHWQDWWERARGRPRDNPDFGGPTNLAAVRAAAADVAEAVRLGERDGFGIWEVTLTGRDRRLDAYLSVCASTFPAVDARRRAR